MTTKDLGEIICRNYYECKNLFSEKVKKKI